MTRLKKSVAVAQGQLSDVQAPLLTVELECDDYRLRLGIEEQWRGGLEALLPGLCSRFVEHMSFVDSVRGFLRQDMSRYPDAYLRAIFVVLRDLTVSFALGYPTSLERIV